MISSVEITNHLDESITMELRNPESSGFLIQSIDGLNPGKANINVAEISGGDGSIFNSSRVNTRNIVFSIKFYSQSGLSIEDIRRLSYKYFPIKKRIDITLHTDGLVCETYGYVESNEVDIFSKEEGAIISVICPDPYLYMLEEQITEYSVIESLFEFPFSNESLVENLIEFGSIDFQALKTIVYPGDVEVGIVINLHFDGEATNISITDAETLEDIFIDTDILETMTGQAIASGDEIIISTVKGDKYATLIRDGDEINIINAIGPNPHWFELSKGDNSFSYSADTGSEFIQLKITNRIAYQGL